MRLAFFFFIFSILYGCMPNQGLSTDSDAEINVINISRLEKGMNQVQVLKIMRQPYSDKVFVLDNDTYDIWFYVTNPTAMGQSRMVPLNLTPLTFKNGILIGWGKNYYNFLKRWNEEVEAEKLAPLKPTPSKIEQKNLEDEELEKVLKESIVPGQQQQQAPRTTPPKSAPSISPKTPPKKGKGQPPAEPPLNLTPISPQQPAKPSQQQGPNQPQKQPTQTQPSQSNWSPLEEQPRLPQPSQTPQPPQSPQPPQTPQPPQPSKNVPSQTSMSSKPQVQNGSKDEKSKTKKEEDNKVPLTEEDEDMLQEERDQDFNQT